MVPLSGDASTRRYYRLENGARSFVLALYPKPFLPEELSYLTVHALLQSYELPVARDRRRGRPAGNRAAGGPGRPHPAGRPEGRERGPPRGLYREAVDEIARLQMKAAQGPQKLDCFRIAFDIEKLSSELHYFLKHFLEGHRGCDLSVEDRATVSEAFHELTARSPRGPASCATATTTAAT